MIGKNIVTVRPVPLAEVVSALEKRHEEAEVEMKRRKKEEKKLAEAAPKPEKPDKKEEKDAAKPDKEGAAVVAPEVKKEEHALGLEQRYALEYAKKFAHLGKRKAEEMYEQLMKIDKMKPEVAVKMVDLLPKNKAQIEAILVKERVTSGDKLIEEISSVVKDFSK